MAKTITISYKDNEYTLEYTRSSVEQMERSGFDISAVTTKPMTTLPALFRGAFLAHHKFVKPAVIDEIFKTLGDKMTLLEKLAEMYNEPIEAMLDEPETSKGNPGWGVNW